MSSENGSEGSCSEGGDNICRDYLRNVCRRGKRCKYTHPDEKEQQQQVDSISEMIFCHDFQNSQCLRVNCRFVHGTREDENFFRMTGKLPQHVLETVLRKGIASNIPGSKPGEAPVCRDYLKGECRRGGKCKFRHLTVREYELELGYTTPPWQTTRLRSEPEQLLHECLCERELGPPDVKRRHIISVEPAMCLRETHHHCFTSAGLMSHAEARSMLIEDENALLRKKVEELKKQVSDLTATNEFLLDQNAQLRMGSKRANAVTAVTVPAVTITNTGAQAMQVQPITAQIQPAQAPQMAVATGTIRTVPVSIAAVAGAPVSIATVSMAPVQLTPPVVTMAQPALAVEGPPPQPPPPPGPPPQGVQQQGGPPPPPGPQTLPLSISGATAPLVSYPIMTQDLRPVLQTSLSH